MKRNNPLLDKTYALALDSINLYKILVLKQEYVLSKQLLKSSTSPGAMAREAQSAHSKKDFICKLEIGLKELGESFYWFNLLCDSGYLIKEEHDPFASRLKECEALFTSIIKTAKSRLNNP
jgi:four helix bundle protein